MEEGVKSTKAHLHSPPTPQTNRKVPPRGGVFFGGRMDCRLFFLVWNLTRFALKSSSLVLSGCPSPLGGPSSPLPHSCTRAKGTRTPAPPSSWGYHCCFLPPCFPNLLWQYPSFLPSFHRAFYFILFLHFYALYYFLNLL